MDLGVLQTFNNMEKQITTMKKLAFLLGIGFLILLIGQAKGYTQDLYYYDNTTATDFSMTGYANVTSDLENCTTNLRIYADIIGGSGKALDFFLYENGTQLGSTTLYTTNENASCVLMKSETVNKGDVKATARVVNIGSPVTTNLFLEIHTSCGLVNNATISVFNNESAYLWGIIGKNMYMQRLIIDWVNFTDILDAWNNLVPSRCTLTNKKIPTTVSVDTPSPYSYSNGVLWLVPFNSGLGSVNITWLHHTGIYARVMLGLINLQTGSVTNLFNASGGAVAYYYFSGNLLPSTNYVAWMTADVFSFSQNFEPPSINITLTDYVANYTCNITACMNGSATRTCVDTGGIAPDTINSISCLPANQTIYLGFEDYFPKTTTECIVGSTCFFTPVDITYNNPENPHWSILPNSVIIYPPNQTQGEYYGGTMTGAETFTINGTTYTVSSISQNWNRGSNFLKLWYLPPFYTHAFFEPNTSSFQCGNTSIGLQSISTFEYVNSTFLAALNFTFPSSTMSMYLDVRKCPAAKIQYTPPFYCLLSGGQACYGGCSVEPLGNYFLAIFDVTNGSTVLTYNDISLKENWTTIRIDVSNIINQDHNYRLILGVSPPSGWTFDANPYCSYFDNVRLYNQQYSTLETICLDLFGQSCSSLTPQQLQQAQEQFCSPPQECIGNDLYTNSLVNGVCVSKILTNEPSCVAQQQSQIVSGNQSLFLPITSITGTIINTTTGQTLGDSIKAQGFGFALVFFTPIFWLVMFIAAMMIVAAYYTKHMEIGLGIGVLLLMAFTTVFPELLFITITVTVIVAYLVGRAVVGAVRGG
jgi:hypothetical protein